MHFLDWRFQNKATEGVEKSLEKILLAKPKKMEIILESSIVSLFSRQSLLIYQLQALDCR